MKKEIRVLLVTASIFIVVSFLIILVNQTLQVIQLAHTLHPVFGQLVGWLLVLIYVSLFIIPIYIVFRLPESLIPPESINSPEFTLYLEKLSRRLSRNPVLECRPVTTRREVEDALKILDGEAIRIIKNHAGTVFVTTAISQSGRLDTLMVLATQFRMVWQITHLYYQRPTLREMSHLFANVAVTAFAAGELSDIDISQQVEPIVSSVVGASLTGSIPGVTVAAGIITNSLISGSANAFLTLRVGVITRQYCGSLIQMEKSLIRRSASAEAAKILGSIVMQSAGSISRAIMDAAIKKPGRISRDLIRSTWSKLTTGEKSGLDNRLK